MRSCASIAMLVVINTEFYLTGDLKEGDGGGTCSSSDDGIREKVSNRCVVLCPERKITIPTNPS